MRQDKTDAALTTPAAAGLPKTQTDLLVGGAGVDLHEWRWLIWGRSARGPARGLGNGGAEAVHEVADVNGGGDEVIDREWADNLFSADAMQAAADGAAALRAVRGAAEDARFDAASQVRGIIGGKF